MRLLIDSHVPRALAAQLRNRGIDTFSLSEWLEGRYRNASDEEILTAAFDEQYVFATYDLATIPELVVELARTGRHHAGVIFVDERTIRSTVVGGLLRAVVWPVEHEDREDWTDQVRFLRRR